MELESEKSTLDPPPHSKRLKYFTTVAILLGNITWGQAFNYYSPALKAIQNKYAVDTDEISVVFTVMLICYCVGALSSTPIYMLMNKQLGVLLCLFGMALALYTTPHAPNKTIFFVIGGILGYFAGAYDSSQVVWMVELWQEKSGPLIQLQHFCYALGTNIPPLILGPWLPEENSNESDPNIYIPFTICGSLTAAAGTFQLALFIFLRYYTPVMYGGEKGEKIEEKVGDKKSLMERISWPKVKRILVTGMFLGAYQGMEMTTLQFLPTFGQNSALELSESAAANVLTGLTGAFAAGRLIGIFIIFKVNPLFMLIGNLILVLCGNIVLLIWADTNWTMFWVAAILIGLGFSTMYPSFSAFIENHLIFTDAVGSFMIVCGSTIAAIYPVIVGQSIEEKVVVLSFVNFVSIGACIISLIGGWWWTRGCKIRY